MKYDNHIKIEFMSKSCNESLARTVVAAFVSQLDPTLEDMADIRTAVSEAVTNAIIHGYEGGKGKVVMECYLLDRTVEIKITDKGMGIENLELAMQPLYTSKPELERSGMGFTVMQSFMDFLEVKSEINKGTTIIMRKYIKNAA